MTEISKNKQPEPSPVVTPVGAPSLWLYLLLLAGAAGLTWLAFYIKGETDWPGLLSNLAAGLVGSVVILILVDQRLRASEINAIGRFPTRTLPRLIFPSERAASRYVQNLLLALEPLVVSTLERAAFVALETKARSGFVLVGAPGSGKTAWTQYVALNLGRRYLAGEENGRVAILLRIRAWLPDRTLHQALYETFSSYAVCSRRMFDRILATRSVVILLDGYDELWDRTLPFHSGIEDLRRQFPRVALTITSRPDKPTDKQFGDRVPLPDVTDEELVKIARLRS